MSESKHTRGPWAISFEAPRWIIQADHGPGKKAVAWLVGDYVSCAADARLIAAAPDLLAALRPFAEACEHLHPSQPDDGLTLDGIEVRHWRAAYAAFAKVTAPEPQHPTLAETK